MKMEGETSRRVQCGKEDCHGLYAQRFKKFAKLESESRRKVRTRKDPDRSEGKGQRHAQNQKDALDRAGNQLNGRWDGDRLSPSNCPEPGEQVWRSRGSRGQAIDFRMTGTLVQGSIEPKRFNCDVGKKGSRTGTSQRRWWKKTASSAL